MPGCDNSLFMSFADDQMRVVTWYDNEGLKLSQVL